MNILYIIFLPVIAFLGAVFGSFINCTAWRVSRGEDFMHGRSRCPECGHVLGAKDLVPVFSYLFLKGKCRYCKTKIPARYVAVECVMAAAFTFSALCFGPSVQAARCMGLAVILTGIALVDLDTYRIPNGFIAAAGIWWGLMWAAETAVRHACPSGDPWPAGYKGLIQPAALYGQYGLRGFLSGLAGGFGIALMVFLISVLFDKLTGKESLGGGDIKLFFAAGLFLGFPGGLLDLVLSCVTGLLFAAGIKKNRIPFGPAIALATWACMFIGPPVTEWYLKLCNIHI